MYQSLRCILKECVNAGGRALTRRLPVYKDTLRTRQYVAPRRFGSVAGHSWGTAVISSGNWSCHLHWNQENINISCAECQECLPGTLLLVGCHQIKKTRINISDLVIPLCKVINIHSKYFSLLSSARHEQVQVLLRATWKVVSQFNGSFC